uniref:DnaJ (Hsp40) homolog, subfamily C, member 30b n=1 Tax=Pundamilia nyererei TaxID=303518 RepID=A0A3B4FAG6_9CICH
PLIRLTFWRSEDAPLLHRSRTAYYDILKVSLSATQSQIKTAYYKQSFIYHPDKNPGSKEATQRFSDISEAYTVLGNISLRRKYDRGILSRASSRSTGSQQKPQQRARQFSQPGGRPIFDFDAFYQAHYGEQLQREKDQRARKQRMEEELKKHHSRWRQKKMMKVAVVMLLAMAGLIIINSDDWSETRIKHPTITLTHFHSCTVMFMDFMNKLKMSLLSCSVTVRVTRALHLTPLIHSVYG